MTNATKITALTRGYYKPIASPPKPRETKNAKRARKSKPAQDETPWARDASPAGYGVTLTLDIETTTDVEQSPKIIVWQINGHGASRLKAMMPPVTQAGKMAIIDELQERGIAYFPDQNSPEEIARLCADAITKNYTVEPYDRWLRRIFIPYAVVRRCTIVGYNLAFDLGRLAIRVVKPKRDKALENGFSCQLTWEQLVITVTNGTLVIDGEEIHGEELTISGRTLAVTGDGVDLNAQTFQADWSPMDIHDKTLSVSGNDIWINVKNNGEVVEFSPGNVVRKVRGSGFRLTGDTLIPKWKSRWPSLRFAKLSHAHVFKFSRYWDTQNDEYRTGGDILDLMAVASILRKTKPGLVGACDGYRDIAVNVYGETFTFKKSFAGEHGTITSQYIDYALGDLHDTYLLYRCIRHVYQQHGVYKYCRLSSIYSEASLVKAYFAAMGVQPFVKYKTGDGFDGEDEREDLPDPSPEAWTLTKCRTGEQSRLESFIGKAMTTFFGGRVETAIARVVTECLVCDFTSQYPAVADLLGLQEFLTAKFIDIDDGPRVVTRARDILKAIAGNMGVLRDKTLWPRLRVFVKIKPTGDLLPVRADYGGGGNNIAQGFVECGPALWYTLLDVIASVIRTGRVPAIESAFEFRPSDEKIDQSPIFLMGDKGLPIDLLKDKFFLKVVEQRNVLKNKMKGLSHDSEDYRRLNAQEQMLKVFANSGSYGLFVEFITETYSKKIACWRYGGEDAPVLIQSKSFDRPGKYNMGGMGSLITGGGRLLLAIAERLGRDHGIGFVTCDTDGVVFGKPATLRPVDFRGRIEGICAWFQELSPYDPALNIPFFKMESVNKDEETNDYRALYCYAISPKRYALFNIDDDGTPYLRKASASALPSVIVPKDYVSDAPDMARVYDVGLRAAWQFDLWQTSLHSVVRHGHPAIDRRLRALAAMMKVTVSTWHVYEQIGRIARPGGFFSVIQGIQGIDFLEERIKFPDAAPSRWRDMFDTLTATTTHYYSPRVPDGRFHAEGWCTLSDAGKPGTAGFVPRGTRVVLRQPPVSVFDRVLDHFEKKDYTVANGEEPGQRVRRNIVISEDIRYCGKTTNNIKDQLWEESDNTVGYKSVKEFKETEYVEHREFEQLDALISWTRKKKAISIVAHYLCLDGPEMHVLLKKLKKPSAYQYAKWLSLYEAFPSFSNIGDFGEEAISTTLENVNLSQLARVTGLTRRYLIILRNKSRSPRFHDNNVIADGVTKQSGLPSKEPSCRRFQNPDLIALSPVEIEQLRQELKQRDYAGILSEDRETPENYYRRTLNGQSQT